MVREPRQVGVQPDYPTPIISVLDAYRAKRAQRTEIARRGLGGTKTYAEGAGLDVQVDVRPTISAAL